MDGKVLEAELRALAARQHGVVSRTQARRLGASRRSLARRLAGPGREAPAPQVLRLVGTTDTFSQRCMAGALDVGPSAVVSRSAAAALWGLPAFIRGDVHVTRPVAATSRTSRLAVVHESRYLPEHHCTVREAIPLTTVARTVFDLAGCLHPARTERAMENGLKSRFCYRRHRLVIEIDSDLHHTAKLDAESDARRDQAMRAAGFEVLRITEHQLRERPDQVVAVVRGALEPPNAPERSPQTRPFCPPSGVRTGGEAVGVVR